MVKQLDEGLCCISPIMKVAIMTVALSVLRV